MTDKSTNDTHNSEDSHASSPTTPVKTSKSLLQQRSPRSITNYDNNPKSPSSFGIGLTKGLYNSSIFDSFARSLSKSPFEAESTNIGDQDLPNSSDFSKTSKVTTPHIIKVNGEYEIANNDLKNVEGSGVSNTNDIVRVDADGDIVLDKANCDEKAAAPKRHSEESTPKRKRGRPRKYPIKQEEQAKLASPSAKKEPSTPDPKSKRFKKGIKLSDNPSRQDIISFIIDEDLERPSKYRTRKFFEQRPFGELTTFYEPESLERSKSERLKDMVIQLTNATEEEVTRISEAPVRKISRAPVADIDDSIIIDSSGNDSGQETDEKPVVKRGRGRPKLSEEEKLRRQQLRQKIKTTETNDTDTPGKRSRGRPRLPEAEKESRRRQRLAEFNRKFKRDEVKEKSEEKDQNDRNTNSESESESDDGFDDGDVEEQSDESDKEFNAYYAEKHQKSKRGRPRLSEEEKLRRQRLRDEERFEKRSKREIKKQLKEVKQKKLGEIIEIKEDDYSEEEVLDDDSDVDVTKFVFLSNIKEEQGDKDKAFVSKEKRFKEITKNLDVINAEVFETPKKQRDGALFLPSAQRTPSRRGTFMLNIPKTPNGRSGFSRKLDFFRDKLSNIDFEPRDLEFEDADSLFNERERERERERPAPSQSVTPVLSRNNSFLNLNKSSFAAIRSRYGLPFNTPNFIPTPLPNLIEDEQFFDGKYSDQSLFLDGPDGYFDQHKIKNQYSNNSMIQAPQLDYDEFNSLVLLSGFLHHQQKYTLMQKYKEMFSQFYYELTENFNLLFYGVGSKRHFIENFIQEYLLDRINDDSVPVLVVNGYNPATTLKEVLTKIIQTLKISKAPKVSSEMVEFLMKRFASRSNKPELVLVINNIDGHSFRDDKTQNYLSKLCSVKQFFVISSIDHLFSPLLWNSSRATNFNFVWHKTSTYMDYLTETSFDDPLILGQTQKSAGSKGAKFVLSSLTENSKALYRVLASNQLQNMEEDLATKRDQSDTTLKGALKHGLLFSHFFALCAEEFISSNELNFRTMLMEFVEHKMCVLTKDQAGIEKVFIPFTLAEISKLLTDELL